MVYATATKREEIGQGDRTLKAKGKVVQEEAGEIGSARGWRLLKVTLRNGKLLKDYKQRSDMTRFTMAIISPRPFIFDFSVSEQPIVMESHVTRVTITSGNSCCPISTDCPFTHRLATVNVLPLRPKTFPYLEFLDSIIFSFLPFADKILVMNVSYILQECRNIREQRYR